MHRDEDLQVTGTMSDYLVQKLSDEMNGQEFAREYLKADFLAAAVDALFYARREAGLTQEQVAQKLGKKQEAIARWEADTDGKMSLRQYVEIALACDMIPLDIILEPIDSVRDYVIHNPQAPRTQYLYSDWLQKHSEPISVLQPTAVHALTNQAVTTVAPNLVLPTQESTLEGNLVVNLVEQPLKGQYWSQAYQLLVQCAGPGATNTTSFSQISTVSQTQVSPARAATFQDKVAA